MFFFLFHAFERLPIINLRNQKAFGLACKSLKKSSMSNEPYILENNFSLYVQMGSPLATTKKFPQNH